jgi:hypothetical protein
VSLLKWSSLAGRRPVSIPPQEKRLQSNYEAWQFTLGQVEKVDGQIALQLGRMKCDRALPPLSPKARPKRRVN